MGLYEDYMASVRVYGKASPVSASRTRRLGKRVRPREKPSETRSKRATALVLATEQPSPQQNVLSAQYAHQQQLSQQPSSPQQDSPQQNAHQAQYARSTQSSPQQNASSLSTEAFVNGHGHTYTRTTLADPQNGDRFSKLR